MQGVQGDVGVISSELHQGSIGLQFLHCQGVELDGSILLAERGRLPCQCEGGRCLAGNSEIPRSS